MSPDVVQSQALPRWVFWYRVVVAALVTYYFVDRFGPENFGNLDEFGWQFRYLTIWALTGSLIAAVLMLVPRFGARNDSAAVFVSVVAIMNAMVVGSYWRLYFQDPALVRGDDATIILYREYYLHLLGPLLQWIDVLFLKRAFRFPLRTMVWLGAVVLAYVLWAELVVQPLNTEPVGTIATGLPYPFLNDMVIAERARFYTVTFVAGVVFVAVFWLIQVVTIRVTRR